MAYISCKDCAKAVVYALLAYDLHYMILNINDSKLMTLAELILQIKLLLIMMN